MVLENFFTGREKPLTDTETADMIAIMRSEKVQQECCDFLIHTGKSYLQLSYSEYFNKRRKYFSLYLTFEKFRFPYSSLLISSGTYKKANLPKPTFKTPLCETTFPVEDFLNQMTISYQKVTHLMFMSPHYMLF